MEFTQKNRPEWQLVSEACYSQCFITVSLYDAFNEEQCKYIINHAEISVMFVTNETIGKILKAIEGCSLKYLVNFDEPTEKQKKICSELGVKLFFLPEIEELGKMNPVNDVEPDSNTVCSILYTSGTTGLPKGVLLTHENIMATIGGALQCIPPVDSSEVILSYLPLAHVFNRVVEELFFDVGGAIGYFNGDFSKIADDFIELRPTCMVAVPRVLDILYNRVQKELEKKSWIAKYIFKTAYEMKKSSMKNGISTPILDYFVFSAIQEKLGGRLKKMLVGGAPLSPTIQEFFVVTLDAVIINGYGSTETSGGGTLNVYYDFHFGTQGTVNPCCEIKLVDVPEMDYTKGQREGGEICIRGPCVSSGYYKNDEETNKVFDKDGWYHTGDIGIWNKNGTLSIIDRKKNIFKLSQGEYVASEQIENVYNTCRYIDRVFVYGDSFKNCLVGIAKINQAMVETLAKEVGIKKFDNIDEFCDDERVRKFILKKLEELGREMKFAGFLILKNIKLISEDFARYNGVTPTLKLKRHVLKEVFKKHLDELYEELK